MCCRLTGFTLHRTAVNFKGIGNGIKENTEDTARRAAKGFVGGVRDAIRGKGTGAEKPGENR